ncbi:MAG: hypothetical protein HY317_06375 [Acidobacteria bacterium]|nr:hypothetical protein [Acidobacteriota bacterium]
MPPLTDTDRAAEEAQVRLLRAATPARRTQAAFSLSRAVIELARRALRRAAPDATDEEIGLRFVALHYGDDLAQRVRAHLARTRRP